MVATDELGALVASAGTKKKRNSRFAYSNSLKGQLKWCILVVASQFASVDIPNAVRSQLSTKILLGSAPAELVQMVFQHVPALGLGSARQFEGLCL